MIDFANLLAIHALKPDVLPDSKAFRAILKDARELERQVHEARQVAILAHERAERYQKEAAEERAAKLVLQKKLDEVLRGLGMGPSRGDN